nr:PREDICTED: adhesion G-protein coupled receptor G4-like [Lepisosteus oculatus]
MALQLGGISLPAPQTVGAAASLPDPGQHGGPNDRDVALPEEVTPQAPGAAGCGSLSGLSGVPTDPRPAQYSPQPKQPERSCSHSRGSSAKMPLEDCGLLVEKELSARKFYHFKALQMYDYADTRHIMLSGRKMLLWHLSDKKALGCPLFILLLLCNTPEGDGYFLGGSKAVFPSGCSQTWTIAEDVHVPQLTQLTVCVDIRLRASGDWTAFTYSTTQSQSQDLAITGDKKNVYVWLLGVQFPFPVNLSLNNWYHVCLKLNGQKQSISLDINGSPSVLKVNTTVVPPGGALVLGCKDSSTQRPSQNPGQAELYLFRVWSDINSHGTCEDGNVIGWDSEQWIFSKETLVPDASLTCSLTSTTVPPVANPSQGYKRVRRQASGSTSTAPSANTPSTTTQAVSGSGATVYSAATPSAPAAQ